METVLGGLPLTEEPQPPAINHSDESRVDRELDRLTEKHPEFTHAIDNLMIPGFDQKLGAVLSDLDKEAAADQAMLAEFAKLPDAESPGVSVTALSDADKTFDDHEVVRVARDCCLILQKARVDVLLSDIAMPEEDGYALIRRVRSSPSPEVAAIPAAAVTAFTSADDRARALAAGFQVPLAKPLEPLQLVRIVERLVDQVPL